MLGYTGMLWYGFGDAGVVGGKKKRFLFFSVFFPFDKYLSLFPLRENIISSVAMLVFINRMWVEVPVG